jgi:UDP-N-acetylmuramate--alanine ligase
MHVAGLDVEKALPSLAHFGGVTRRMEIFKYNGKTIIDDYAHHPKEIKAVFNTTQSFFKEKSNRVIFQPHLFSRTRDFMEEFAKILSQFDEVVLMDIYPAREDPIPGVTAHALLDLINNSNKQIISTDNFVSVVEEPGADLVLILGAGDIGVYVQNLKKNFE